MGRPAARAVPVPCGGPRFLKGFPSSDTCRVGAALSISQTMSAKKLIHVAFILGIIVAATASAQSQGDPYHGPVLSLDVPQGWKT